MGARNYLMISGSDFLKEPDAGNEILSRYDILTISTITAMESNCYIQRTRIIELGNEGDIQVCRNSELFFFNKILLNDPSVRVQFDYREMDSYEFIFTQGEIDYILHTCNLIKSYQVNQDHDFGEKFISNILGHFIMHYKIVRDRKKDKLESYTDRKYYQQRAYKFFEAVVSYHNVNRNLSFYAEQVMVSRRTLSKITKEVFGKSPKCILDNYIVEMAKEYLRQPNIPLKMVGSNLGFTETSNFMTFFKKITKLTPTEFRDKYLLNISKKTIVISIAFELLFRIGMS